MYTNDYQKFFNNYIINEIDDIYFMSEYITFIFFDCNGGLLEIHFLDKLINHKKFKKIKIFIIDQIFYNLKRKAQINNFIKKKNKNIICKIYPNVKKFYEYTIANYFRIDFIIGINNYFNSLNNINKIYWKALVLEIVGTYGVNDKSIYILYPKKNKIKIKSLYYLINK